MLAAVGPVAVEVAVVAGLAYSVVASATELVLVDHRSPQSCVTVAVPAGRAFEHNSE